MQHLPSAEEQEWLASHLAGLVDRCGSAQFLEKPIVELTPEFFPDPWSFSHRGLDRIVRRLLQYAGLGELKVSVETFLDEDQPLFESTRHSEQKIAAIFLGIEDNCCRFAFCETAPADQAYMAGVMAHEVAHAYRAYHQLVTHDVDEEELLTDLTAVYLGFGLLVTNASFRSRTSGTIEGNYVAFSWNTTRTGYLPAQAFAFLLACQFKARQLTARAESRLIRQLETDQAAFTHASCREVECRRVEIVSALGLPVVERPNHSHSLEDILRPLPEYVEYEAEADENAADERSGFNAGYPVFRLPASRAYPFAACGGLIGMLAGAYVLYSIRSYSGGFLCVIVGMVAGGALGARSRYEICSDPECTHVLGEEEFCPNCGGQIVGTIKHVEDRYDAAHEWESQQRSATRSRGRQDR